MNPSKAAGPEGLHCKLLFELRDILCEPLVRLFNRSLQEGDSVASGSCFNNLQEKE